MHKLLPLLPLLIFCGCRTVAKPLPQVIEDEVLLGVIENAGKIWKTGQERVHDFIATGVTTIEEYEGDELKSRVVERFRLYRKGDKTKRDVLEVEEEGERGLTISMKGVEVKELPFNGYKWTYIGEDTLNGSVTYLISTTLKCKEQEMEGIWNLWIDKGTQTLSKSIFKFTKLPLGLEEVLNMKMEILYYEVEDGIWLPKREVMEVDIRFLMLFRRNIKTTTKYEEYELSVGLEDALFEK